MIRSWLGTQKTNFTPGTGGTVSMVLENTVNIFINGENMKLIVNLGKWHEGDYLDFSGTLKGLATGADYTDYTIKFDIVKDGVILQTLEDTLDANGAFNISEQMDPSITAATYEVYSSIWWQGHSSYEEKFNKKIWARPTSS